MEFLLTDHTYRILVGRGMELVCKECRMAIHVTGYGKCPLCGHHTESLGEWSDKERKRISKCEKCGKEGIPIKWTTVVISKHRKKRKNFYHKECWDKHFINGNSEE